MVFDTSQLEPGYYGISEDKTLYKLSLKADFPLWSRSYNLMTGEVHYPTNRDRLRHMTDEELAEFIAGAAYDFGRRLGRCDVCDTVTLQHCEECWLDWLTQEVQENE